MYAHPPVDAVVTAEGLRLPPPPERVTLPSAVGPLPVAPVGRLAGTDAWIEIEARGIETVRGWVELDARRGYPIHAGDCTPSEPCVRLQPFSADVQDAPQAAIGAVVPPSEVYPYLARGALSLAAYPPITGAPSAPQVTTPAQQTPVRSMQRMAERGGWAKVTLADGTDGWLAWPPPATALISGRRTPDAAVMWSRSIAAATGLLRVSDLRPPAFGDLAAAEPIALIDALPPALRGEGLPDLVISDVKVNTLRVGGPCILPLTVRNRGTGVALIRGKVVDWVHSWATPELEAGERERERQSSDLRILAPGATMDLDLQVFFLATGRIAVDFLNMTPESNEQNNAWPLPSTNLVCRSAGTS
ncbi:MAG: hypothetical protein U0531_01015 [Dehalococcoidia bacterium]